MQVYYRQASESYRSPRSRSIRRNVLGARAQRSSRFLATIVVEQWTLTALGFSTSGWLAVILTFVLGRVFAEGTLMQKDLEGTV